MPGCGERGGSPWHGGRAISRMALSFRLSVLAGLQCSGTLAQERTVVGGLISAPSRPAPPRQSNPAARRTKGTASPAMDVTNVCAPPQMRTRLPRIKCLTRLPHILASDIHTAASLTHMKRNMTNTAFNIHTGRARCSSSRRRSPRACSCVSRCPRTLFVRTRARSWSARRPIHYWCGLSLYIYNYWSLTNF